MDHGKPRGLVRKSENSKEQINEKASRSEEANVGLADEAVAIVSLWGKKMESRNEKGSVTIWEFDSDV